MQFTSMPNFTGTVTFACSGAPAGSTCAISPSSLPVTGQTIATLNLIVNSTTSSTAVRSRINDPRPRNLYSQIPWQAALLALLLPAIVFARRTKLLTASNFGRLRFAHFAMLLALSAWLVTSACGGMTTVANNPVTPPSGPVPGAYTLTVVATSGTTSVSLNVTLTVQ
jgi:hypothetical protein